jgi:hypothetical protein
MAQMAVMRLPSLEARANANASVESEGQHSRRAGDARDEFLTPPKVLDAVRSYFVGSIPLDPATTAANPTGATRYFTRADDGLRQSWAGSGVFVSPPGGRSLKPWVQKIGREARAGLEVVAQLPAGAQFGNLYWQDALLTEELRVICWIRRKLRFVDSAGARVSYPYASCVLGLNVDRDRFQDSFRLLGKVSRLARLGPGGEA